MLTNNITKKQYSTKNCINGEKLHAQGNSVNFFHLFPEIDLLEKYLNYSNLQVYITRIHLMVYTAKGMN